MSATRWSHSSQRGGDEFSGQMAQVEAEKRARKETEERNRYLVKKVEQIQEILKKKNQEVEEERRAREEAERTCESLQMTINKLEEYLRKKHLSAETSLLPIADISNEKPIVSDLSKLDNDLRKTKEELEREKHYRQKAEQRCADLEEHLVSMGTPLEMLSIDATPRDSLDEVDFKF